MEKMNAKKWIKWFIAIIFTGLFVCGSLTAIVDPYFHFHKPLPGISYRLYEQRYINDGIARYFDYDAIIMGNSLTENFKTSQFDKLFHTRSVKLPYSGAGIKELWESLGRALSRQNHTTKALVVLDSEDVMRHSKWTRYQDYPEYLYDDCLWNDVHYLFNKEIFYRGTIYDLMMTITGKSSTTFDEYSSWIRETGKEKALAFANNLIESGRKENREITDKDLAYTAINIQENIIPVVQANPDTTFYLFFPPDSIAQWYKWYWNGELEWRIAMLQVVMEQLLQEENIQLYGFYDCYDWTCNLDNYNDTIHFTAELNAAILENISNNQHRITKENYLDYIEQIKQFYENYDYESLQS